MKIIEAAYYNEIDPYCYAWLENLIRRKLIMPGDVDGRSIEDVLSSDVMPYRQAHFFAGIGVWSYAAKKAHYKPRTKNERLWTGSCPCQPFSTAGARRGFADERHLWPAWFHLIQQCKPELVFGEQVAHGGAVDWYALVRADLASKHYQTGNVVLDAGGFGAPFKRTRRFFVGYYTGSITHESRRESAASRRARRPEYGGVRRAPARSVWSTEPRPTPVADGAAKSVDQVRAYGNAIVAPVAIEFIKAALACRP